MAGHTLSSGLAIRVNMGDQRGVATLARARVPCLRSPVQNEKPRFAAVASSVAGPARLVAQFRICLANSERDAGVIGLPVFIAVINSAELLGMVSATGSLTALAIPPRSTSPLERKRLMTTFILPGGKLYCNNLST